MLTGTEALENYHRLLAEGKLEEAAQEFESASSAFDESRSMVQFLCKRCGVNYMAPNCNEVILTGVQRLQDEGQNLLDELEKFKDKSASA